MFDVGVRAAAVVVLVVATLAGCGNGTLDHVTFAVEGMTCESCSSAITEALERVEGVASADADHLAGTAEAVVGESSVSDTDLIATIEDLGYTVTRVDRTFG